MTVHSINWPSFAVFNADKNIQNQFEELCRQLFIHEFVSQNKTHIYLHNNHNNPGLESEPILYEKEEIYIGYQAKYFQGSIGYSQIEDSLKKPLIIIKENWTESIYTVIKLLILQQHLTKE